MPIQECPILGEDLSKRKPEAEMPAFTMGLSVAAETLAAGREVCEITCATLRGSPDLAICFASQSHAAGLESVLATIDERLRPRTLIGCTAESVVGMGREVERQPAISLWVARLPGAEIHATRLSFQSDERGGGAIVGWNGPLPTSWPSNATLLLLADPFSFPTAPFLDEINKIEPHIPVIGGLASGGNTRGGNRLFVGQTIYDSGAIGLMIAGSVRVHPILSTGCKPIGNRYSITKSEPRMLRELDGLPAAEKLQEAVRSYGSIDTLLAEGRLYAGIADAAAVSTNGASAFRMHKLLNMNRTLGALAVGGGMRVGQTVQFHLRDREAANEGWRSALNALDCEVDMASSGALLFTCVGRGRRMFPQPHHDIALMHERFGTIPIGGCFAQGEIGSNGKTSYLHNFAASAALFTAAS
jgi:small ligand-binding sensory domain FIST